MITEMEARAAQQFAATMSDKDLRWQIANARTTGTEALKPYFEAELARRIAPGLAPEQGITHTGVQVRPRRRRK